MGTVLLGLLTIMEIALVVITFTRFGEKISWLRNRAVCRAIEWFAFVLILLLMKRGGDFRFRFCLILLLIRAAVALILYLLKRRKASGNQSKAGAIVNAVCGIILLAISLIPSFLFTGYRGLETTGAYKVKHAAAIVVDENRTETFEMDGSKREVPVHFYYPETESAGDSSFPLVLFSHGAFGYYQSNTSTYMELASNGYVVVSLDHPYHSFFTKDTDGKLITVNPDFLNEVMSSNDESVSKEEVFRLSHKWLEIRTADIRFVLDSIKNAKTQDALTSAWFVSDDGTGAEIRKVLAMTDTDKIGLMGHSLGGAASVTVGRQREDIDAVIDIDGTMIGEETGYADGKYQYPEEPYPVPLLSIDNESHYLEGKTSDLLYVNQFVLANALDSRHTYFVGSGHMNFTDLPLLSPALSSLLGTGSIDETKCVQTMNQLILTYYNAYLKGEGEAVINESYF